MFPTYADSNGIWTYPCDITPGVFGEDESSNPSENYTFNNEIYFNQLGTFNHELITNSRFTANDVFYTTSNIGIGVVNPTNRLEVSGNIESNQFIDYNDNFYLLDPNGVSNIYRVVADSYFSPGTSVYYLNPAGTSRVGVLNANTLQIGGVHTDNLYVNENQANSISSNMISNNQIQEVDLEVTNSPTNNYILSYDSSSGGFTWINPSTFSGGVTVVRFKDTMSPTTFNNKEISSRNLNSDLNMFAQVTFYSASQDTANFLCREQLNMQFGYWRTVGKPCTLSWLPCTYNLAISAYDPTSSNSRNEVCDDIDDCHSHQLGIDLYCYSIEQLPSPSEILFN